MRHSQENVPQNDPHRAEGQSNIVKQIGEIIGCAALDLLPRTSSTIGQPSEDILGDQMSPAMCRAYNKGLEAQAQDS